MSYPDTAGAIKTRKALTHCLVGKYEAALLLAAAIGHGTHPGMFLLSTDCFPDQCISRAKM